MNMHMKPFDHDELLKLDGDVPFVRSVPYGIQHALAMFVANLVLPRIWRSRSRLPIARRALPTMRMRRASRPRSDFPLRAVAMGSEPPHGAASSDVTPASAPASAKAWEPFEKPHERAEK